MSAVREVGSGRLGVVREPGFGWFFAAYVTSHVGSAMTPVGLAFVVLGANGALSELGWVLAARILPVVLLLPVGGVLGDRLPRRLVMMASDCVRALSLSLVVSLAVAGQLDLGSLLLLAALGGVGEAFFRPSFEGVVPQLVSVRRLPEANAVLGLAQSGATIGGPALAGLLVAVSSPAAALGVAAVSYGASVVLLGGVRNVDARGERVAGGFLRDIRGGWREFTAHTWLYVVTLHAALFNLVVWAPYLVLGPVSADREYGGAGAWGTVVAVYGVGALCGGLAVLGRRPRLPLVVAVSCGFLTAAPPAALAVTAPLGVVCTAALLAGAAHAANMSLWMTTVQRHVPIDALSRVNSYVAFGAFAVGPVGLALAGPIAEATSVGTVLAVGALWQVVACGAVLAFPSVRTVRWGSLPEQ